MWIRIVTRLSQALQRVEATLLSAAILTIAGMTTLNVVCRAVFGFSLAVAEEVSQFCIIVVCFVGISYAAGMARHIRMTAIYDQLRPAARKSLMVVITATTALLMFALAWYAACYVVTVYELGGIYPALRVPFYVVYAIAPLGLFLAGVQYALAAVRNLTSQGTYLSFEVKDEYEHPVTREI